MEKNLQNHKNWHIYAIGFMVIGVAILYFSSGNDTSIGISDGLNLCLGVVIPSLFPFMVISSFIVESGLVNLLGKPLSFFSTKLLRLPASAGAVFFMSLIGGYPAGAKMVDSLLEKKQISICDAKRMIPLCIGAGPGFVITAVGANMFNNSSIGLFLFISQTLSSIIIGIISGQLQGKKQKKSSTKSISRYTDSYSNSFVNSVISSSNALFIVCAFVIIFSGISTLMSSVGIIEFLTNFLSKIFYPTGLGKDFFNTIFHGILEVVQGCLFASKIPGKMGYYLASFFLSFSGLSILFQIIACSPKVKPRLLKIILWRIIHAVIALIILKILIFIFPDMASSQVISTGSYIKPVLSGTPQASAMLFFLCSLFLVSIGNKTKKS